MSDDVPPPEIEPPSSPPPPPPRESAGVRFAESAGRGCLGVVAFIVAVFVFGTIVVANQILGLVVSILVVVGLFVARKRSGPSPMLGAVAVGVSIATILAGGCAILMMMG